MDCSARTWPQRISLARRTFPGYMHTDSTLPMARVRVRKSWTTASRVTICPSATGDRARLAADRNRSSLASCLSAAGDTAWELPTGIV